MNNSQISPRGSGDKALPFIIGVSGHKDIKSLLYGSETGLDGIKEVVKKCLLFWREKVGSETPIWLMTGMAEGSDLLVVDAAEELINEGWSSEFLKIIPCLPMAMAFYERDFEDMDAVRKLKHYIDKYTNNCVLIKNLLPDERYFTALEDSSFGGDRCSLYLSQGAFLARYSNVLICLWDGKESNGYGGTADVAKLKLGLDVAWPIRDEFIPSSLKQPGSFDRHFGGVVQHIPVIRQSSQSDSLITDRLLALVGDKDLGLFPCYISSKVGDEKESILQLTQSEEFMVLLNQLSLHNKSIAGCKDKASNGESPSFLLDSGLIFQESDEIARRYQSVYRRRMSMFFLASFIGYGSYEIVGSNLGSPWGAVLNLMVLAAILTCFIIIRSALKNQWKWKYQLSRGITESMRIRGFLNLADIEPDNQPLILRRYKHRFPVFDHAITVVELEWWKHRVPADYQAVKSEWLESQRRFLKSRLDSSRTSLLSQNIFFERPLMAKELLSGLARITFILATVSGLGLLIMQLLPGIPTAVWQSGHVGSILMVSIQYLMMFAAVVTLWTELAGYDSTVSGYENLIQHYDIAQSVIQTEDKTLIKQVLLSLAKDALLEHCEWTHYESKSDITSKANGSAL